MAGSVVSRFARPRQPEASGARPFVLGSFRHCRFVGEGIEKSVADGEDLFARFEGTPILRFKVEREGGRETVVGGELGGDDSRVVVSESGVTKVYGDEVVGYAFGAETREAMVEFFAAAYLA